MIPGIKRKIGEREYEIPPLSLGQLRQGAIAKIRDHDQMITDGKFFEAMELRGEIIAMAMKRNYPDLKDSDFDELLDVRNMPDLWSIVLGGSGFAETLPNGADPSPLPMTSGPSTGVLQEPTVGQ